MTSEAMQQLSVGDIIKDIARSEQQEREILCSIESMDEYSITLIAILAQDSSAYPHRFFFSRDADTLALHESK